MCLQWLLCPVCYEIKLQYVHNDKIVSDLLCETEELQFLDYILWLIPECG